MRLLLVSIFSPKCLVGYDQESEELNADVLRKYLFGGHVADYMRLLQDENEEKYKTHFSQFIKAGITADNVSCDLNPDTRHLVNVPNYSLVQNLTWKMRTCWLSQGVITLKPINVDAYIIQRLSYGPKVS